MGKGSSTGTVSWEHPMLMAGPSMTHSVVDPSIWGASDTLGFISAVKANSLGLLRRQLAETAEPAHSSSSAGAGLLSAAVAGVSAAAEVSRAEGRREQCGKDSSQYHTALCWPPGAESWQGISKLAQIAQVVVLWVHVFMAEVAREALPIAMC